MRFWSVNGTKDGMFVEVNWLNIMLVIISVVQDVVILVIDLMAHLMFISRVAAFVVLITAMRVLIWCHIAVIGVAITVEGITFICLIVRVRLWSVDGTKDGMFVEVNWLNIVLIIESVVQDVVILVIDLGTHLVLIGRVAAFMILITTICVLIRSNISMI